MKTLLVLSALVALSAPGGVQLSMTAKKLEAKLDKDVFAHFADEIQDSYPAHVKAYAIVKAQILGKREITYCPLRTAQCGEDPTCNHPKKTRVVYDIDILQTVYSSNPTATPKSMPAYTFFQPVELKQNDELWLSLYVYAHQVTANGNANVSRIKKIEAVKADDLDKPAKEKPKFQPRTQ